jgi:hypothetical protein
MTCVQECRVWQTYAYGEINGSAFRTVIEPFITWWDANNDGLLDLIAGYTDGSIHYYQRQDDGSLIKQDGDSDGFTMKVPNDERVFPVSGSLVRFD